MELELTNIIPSFIWDFFWINFQDFICFAVFFYLYLSTKTILCVHNYKQLIFTDPSAIPEIVILKVTLSAGYSDVLLPNFQILVDVDYSFSAETINIYFNK